MSPLYFSGRKPVSAIARWTVLGLVGLLAWDASGLDLAVARWFGNASGFALESSWFWRDLLHDRMRLWPWVLEAGLLLAVVLPVGLFRQSRLARRVQLALTTVAAVAVVSGIKRYSHTSCPWDLQEFGGVARYVSHWAWGLQDGGTGGCFPAGHASSGFAFVGGFFAFRHTSPTVARRWLAAAAVTGLVFGLAQQVRGAHYLSHTLWTAWLCWAVAAGIDAAVTAWLARKQPPVPAPARGP